MMMQQLEPTLAEIHQAKKDRAARFALRAVAQSEAAPRVSNVYDRAAAARAERRQLDEDVKDRVRGIIAAAEANAVAHPIVLAQPEDGHESVYQRISRITGRVSRVKALVADHYGLTIEELIGHCKQRHLTRPRQVAMYICYVEYDFSYPELGRFFDGRDHTTVLHNVHAVRRLIQTDEELRSQVEAIRARLYA